MGNIKKAGDLLGELFRDKFDPVTLETARKTAGLFNSWDALAAAAGIPAASDHSQVRELEHGVLVIEAEHPGWVQILQTKQGQLLNLLQNRFPELEIRGLSFCLCKMQINKAPVNPVPEPAYPDTAQNSPDNKALYEPIKKFKKIIEKRNKKLSKLE